VKARRAALLYHWRIGSTPQAQPET
jgi:hypothetical protein